MSFFVHRQHSIRGFATIPLIIFSVLMVFLLLGVGGYFIINAIVEQKIAEIEKERVNERPATESEISDEISLNSSLEISPAQQEIAFITPPKSSQAISQKKLSKELLKQVMSRVVLVKCYGSDGIAQGSGTTQLVDNADRVVVTNFHVTNGAGGTATCTIQTPVSPDYTTSKSILFQTQRGKFSPYFPDVDVALLHVTNAQTLDSSLFSAFPLPGCTKSQVEIGTNMVVLGYPSFGEDTLTVTEGTISGILPTEYGAKYKTSAKMDHGVSGGLAINTDDSCVIGIPTWGAYSSSFLQDYGVGEVLGQIQSWQSIKDYGEILN